MNSDGRLKLSKQDDQITIAAIVQFVDHVDFRKDMLSSDCMNAFRLVEGLQPKDRLDSGLGKQIEA
jgi:hypothetical protein